MPVVNPKNSCFPNYFNTFYCNLYSWGYLYLFNLYGRNVTHVSSLKLTIERIFTPSHKLAKCYTSMIDLLFCWLSKLKWQRANYIQKTGKKQNDEENVNNAD